MPKHEQLLLDEDYKVDVLKVNGQDYISLTDMVRKFGGNSVIENWLRNKNTIEFLGVWESLNNKSFNSLEFEGIRNEAGLNRFVMSAKKWINSTRALGILARAGRYGGTYAHKDIAFEFGSWISPEFKLLIIKEYQRLKSAEEQQEEWGYHRFLAKVNYRLQTQSIKQILLPLLNIHPSKEWIQYANEADLLNMAVFGTTAKDWRDAYPELAKKGLNIRDKSTILQLTVLANLESFNSMLITEKMSKNERFDKLKVEAKRQLEALIDLDKIRTVPTKLIEGKDIRIEDDFIET